MNDYVKLNFVNGAAPALNADNLNHMEDGISAATDGVNELEAELETAKSELSADIAAKADKATTLAGYGITDAYTKTKVDSKLEQKLDNYGTATEPAQNSPAWVNAGVLYTALLAKADADDMETALADKEDTSNKAQDIQEVTDDNAAQLYPSIAYLQGYYNAASESYDREETDELLAEKYDSSNVETGSGTLSPGADTYSDSAGNFVYSKVGSTITVTLKMTTFTAGKNYVMMKGLPFTAQTTIDLASVLAATSANSVCNVRVKGSWVYFTNLTTTFADSETLAVTVTYKI